MFKLIQNGFIFDDPIPVPECHASTILKTGKDRFVAAWVRRHQGGESGCDDLEQRLS